MIKIYRLKGTFGQKGEKQTFTIDVRATKPEEAKEAIYTNLGSKHKVRRFLIRIDSVEEVEPDDTSSLVASQLSKVN